ncbi:hypothetical protein Poly24_47690 [Rosistilla carotiformis]|uniref:Chemotaxis phosphatase CheX-like domain-containing protein n=1 Tax=Rosistilla carotiformis TaxID=2528017 RepID=A0A518JZQ9_9BACT|nr:chemotaxis protein CheX [Rosistilla carotiformis]QDV71036.1 hypothetical protein Poly24_47690 [Rosistilla carotiformis]
MLTTENEAFQRAVEEIFNSCLGCDAKLKEVGESTTADRINEIKGIIGISGALCGTAALSVSRDFAYKATGALLGDTPHELNSDVVDAVGEIVNMIAGRARVLLGNEATNMSLPSVILGQCEIAFGSENHGTCLRFDTAWGSVSMELVLKQHSKSPIPSVTPVAILA